MANTPQTYGDLVKASTADKMAGRVDGNGVTDSVKAAVVANVTPPKG